MPKMYSQTAEILVYKIRDFGDDRKTSSKFFRRSKIIFIHRSTKISLFEGPLKSMKIEKQLKKKRLFHYESTFDPDYENSKDTAG